MNQDLVSIIVPVYNAEEYLEECICSITNQSYDNTEIILVDDGSTDKSSEICDKLALSDARITVIHKENGGLSSSRNTGLEVAHGKYIMFVDSDDYIDQDMVHSLYDCISKNNLSIVWSPLIRSENGNNRQLNKPISRTLRILSGEDSLKLMLKSKIDVSSCGKIFTRSSINTIRFPLNRYNEDIIFMYNILSSQNINIGFVPTSFYYYRWTPNSLTTKFTSKKFDLILNTDEMLANTSNTEIRYLIEHYRNTVYSNLMVEMIKHNVCGIYDIQYQYMLKHLKRNFKKIIFNANYTLKTKLKVAYLNIISPIQK